MKNANVMVVGGAGFIGSHVVNHLVETNNNVVVLDNLLGGKKEYINPKAQFVWGDITYSESNLRRIIERYDIEYVFNYAAIPYVPVSFKRPLHVFDINARGALMLINAAHDAKVRGILQVSSAEVYGDATGRVNEEAPVRPHSSYGVSKVAVDGLVQVRWREARAPVLALRQFNCVGERETHEYVIPEIISQVSRGDVVHLGNNSFRDFIYAGDAARMAVELIQRGDFGEVYNLGSESGIKIYDLAVLIGKLMGKDIRVEVDESRKRPWEIWHLQSDNTKIYSTVTARPEVSLEEALKRTIAWYEKNGWGWENV